VVKRCGGQRRIPLQLRNTRGASCLVGECKELLGLGLLIGDCDILAVRVGLWLRRCKCRSEQYDANRP